MVPPDTLMSSTVKFLVTSEDVNVKSIDPSLLVVPSLTVSEVIAIDGATLS